MGFSPELEEAFRVRTRAYKEVAKSRPCPECHAEAGKKCVGLKSGKPQERFHVARITPVMRDVPELDKYHQEIDKLIKEGHSNY
jgi:hypothetical protein